MIIKKKSGTYDVYSLEISYGELEAFRAGLEQNHHDPISDEKNAELAWYMERLPKPGEEEKDTKSKEGNPQDPNAEESDLPIPMPPGQTPGTPPEPGEKEPGLPPDRNAKPESGTEAGFPELDADQDISDEGSLAVPPGQHHHDIEPGHEPDSNPALERLKGHGPKPKHQSTGRETDRRLPKPPSE